MSNMSDNVVTRTDESVEHLLEKAAPRPTPPSEDEKIVRDAVYAEWQAVTAKVKTRRRMTYFAIAATVLLGLAVTFNALQVTDVRPVQVATISKSHGSIYLLLGDQAEQQEITDLSVVSVGQVILTGDGAGIGLQWGTGGSLRVDQNTRIEFTSAESVYLHSGRIYFDSQSSQITAAITGSGSEVAADFEIETNHGFVKHLGTQYMTLADAQKLTVSVREGRVSVDGTYVSAAFAGAGEQVILAGGAQASVVDFNGYGAAWDWIEETAPTAKIDGRSVDAFLRWAGREMGLQVEYESAAAKNKAHNGILKGNVDMSPRDELSFRMSGEDLNYRIDGGKIYVSAID